MVLQKYNINVISDIILGPFLKIMNVDKLII